MALTESRNKIFHQAGTPQHNLRGAQQQTRRTPLLLSIDGTDRQTDGRSTVS